MARPARGAYCCDTEPIIDRHLGRYLGVPDEKHWRQTGTTGGAARGGARDGARLARLRRGRMDVILKDGGVPTISALWRDTAQHVSAELKVESVKSVVVVSGLALSFVAAPPLALR